MTKNIFISAGIALFSFQSAFSAPGPKSAIRVVAQATPEKSATPEILVARANSAKKIQAKSSQATPEKSATVATAAETAEKTANPENSGADDESNSSDTDVKTGNDKSKSADADTKSNKAQSSDSSETNHGKTQSTNPTAQKSKTNTKSSTEKSPAISETVSDETNDGEEAPDTLPAKPKKHKSTKMPHTFEVDLAKLAKSLKPFYMSGATDESVKATKNPTIQMKWAETQSEWKTCADLRSGALKSSPNIAGWIWVTAFNCELKIYEQSEKLSNADRKAKKKKPTEASVAQKVKRLKIFITAFETKLDLLDRGPWKKDLQAYWLKALAQLKNQAQSDEDKSKIAEIYFKRPELIPNEIEKDLMQDLQDSFSATKASSITSGRSQPVSLEPWWDAARKMDYEQVVKLLEVYFAQNKSPSNLLSGQLLLGKGYLWTGRYEQAKATFQKLADEYPTTEEGLDAQFRLGLLQLRLGNPQLALQTFDKLLTTGKEKNPLTTRYWKLRALQLTGPQEAFEAERGQIINQYPFTYFGLKLRMEAQQGRLEFPEAAIPETRTNWNFPKSAEAPWKRFTELLKVGFTWEAGNEIQDILNVSDAEAYQMWAEFFSEIKLDTLALKFGQTAQNLDERLVAWSFQKKFMPYAFEKTVQEQAQIHKIEPWIIWGVMRQESAFNIRAVSASNAYGLMQLIGPTAQEVAHDLKTNVSLPEDLFVPEKNIPFGARYLSKVKNEFNGHWPLAVASYNAGPSRLKSWLRLRKDTEGLAQTRSTEWRDEIWIDELPWTETQNYVKSVMRNYILYRLGNRGYWTPPPVFWSESDPSQGVSSRRLIEKKSIKR